MGKDESSLEAERLPIVDPIGDVVSIVRVRGVDDDEAGDAREFEPTTVRDAFTPSRHLLTGEQLGLTVNLLHLQRLLTNEGAELPERTRAWTWTRMGELEAVETATEAVLALTDTKVDRLLKPGAALSVYLKGLYLFCEGIATALEDAIVLLATRGETSDASPEVDCSLRARFAEASQFFFDGLAAPVRAHLTTGATASQQAIDSTSELFFAADYLHDRVRSELRSTGRLPPFS